MSQLVNTAWRKTVDFRQRLDDYIVSNFLRGWTPAEIPDQSGKVALVTGASSGIGLEASRKLAENGAKVYMVARNMKKLEAAAQQIRKEIGKAAQLELYQCDLTSMDNVIKLIEAFKRTGDPLHILINNAGCYFPGPFKLVQGNCEQTMAVNFFAPALLTLGLLDKVQPGGRIVMMSSEGEALGKIDWSDLRGTKCKTSGNTAYSASKLYNLLWATELGARLRGGKGSSISPHPAITRDIDVISVQPGLVATPGHEKMDKEHYFSSWIVSGAAKLFGQSPYHGSWSTIHAATSPSLSGVGHAYVGPNMLGFYHDVKRSPSNRVARNPITAWKLFEEANAVLSSIVGPKMPAGYGVLNAVRHMQDTQEQAIT